ncbi:TonB-dependent receptor [Sunxiuqinia sp. A32]|uniref:TonB-dependent receptor n=1 Tax=Sunxiuqinia sp. A32 TaxID=3461496 RepID=UPI004045E404
MKKKRLGLCLHRHNLEKITRMMKLTFSLLLISLATVAMDAVSQTTKIDLVVEKATIVEIFQQIEESSNVGFFFKNEQLDLTKKYSVNFEKKTVNQILDQLLGDEYSYKYLGKNIVITPKIGQNDAMVQQMSISGKVTDSTGAPLPGVTVVQKGTTNGTITDFEGNYSISNVPEDGTLVFSFVGMKVQEIPVTGENNINVVLAEEAIGLEEVVAVGYGVQNKRALASSISKISSDEIAGSTTANTVDQALQGRISGVQVVETSGEPGAASVVRIRGNNSLSGSNEPLYVIDGMPMPSYREASSSFGGSSELNGLYGINPADIESVEVLKDASATSIYGSRGANGVILITTKKGKLGDSKIEFTNKTTFGNLLQPFSVMNSKQYAEITNEVYSLNGQNEPFGNLDTLRNTTNWIDAITRQSMKQDISLSASGGNKKTAYYISANYLKDKGVLLYSDNEKASVRANVNSVVKKWYTVNFQINTVTQSSNRAITSSHEWPDNGGSFLDALRATPVNALDYLGPNDAGIPNYSGYWFANPYNELKSKTDITKNDFLSFNIENLFTLTDGLKLSVNAGNSKSQSRRQVYFPVSTAIGHNSNGSGSNSLSNNTSFNLNSYLIYDVNFNESHKVNATLGAEYNKQILETLSTSSSGYDIPYFGINNIGSAKNQSIGSYKEDRIIQSAFGRLNYSYKGKYNLNSSIRVDGASAFAENKKYALFPSVALAWNMQEENFMKSNSFFDRTKVRISYGETGSQAISPYSSLAKFGYAFYQIGNSGSVVTSLYPTSLGNSNLSWERTKQLNSGLDLSFFNNRVDLTFDYYIKTTENLLQSRQLPQQSGYGSIIDNYGNMRNKGVELNIQARVVNKRDFKYSTSLNISHNKTILLDLGDKTSSDYVSVGGNLLAGVSGILTPGEEIGIFYGYKVIGLAQIGDFDSEGKPTYAFPSGTNSYQIPGTWKFEDVDGDEEINSFDRQILGKSSPDFVFGWSNDITWKRFNLNFLVNGSVGNDVLNLTRFYTNSGILSMAGVVFNQSEQWYNNRWTLSNQHNNPLYPGTQKGISATDINSTMLEDGSYVRLKYVTLSYTLPDYKFLKNPRIFISGTNIFTITKYSGSNPDVSGFGQSLLQQGIDYGTYPTHRDFTIGLSLTF